MHPLRTNINEAICVKENIHGDNNDDNLCEITFDKTEQNISRNEDIEEYKQK